MCGSSVKAFAIINELIDVLFVFVLTVNYSSQVLHNTTEDFGSLWVTRDGHK